MHKHTITELSVALGNKQVSSTELTDTMLADIQASDLNAFITVCPEQARAQAKLADERRAAGKAGALTGIPMAHKDIFCTDGVKTTSGSKMLDNFIAPYDATAVTKLNDAGMVMLGKTNMDEFAMGSSNETSFYGAVKNPWDASKIPGGSSGGSAAAVAARLVPFASGTDTGGSIRQPAAMCGITGLKPTYGRVSRYGMIAFASSLDQAGTFTQTAEDAALILQAMCGFDAKDSTSADITVPDFSAQLNESLKGKTIGLPKQFFDAGLSSDVGDAIHAAIDEYKRLGANVVDIDLPNINLSVPVYYVIAPAEASSNLSRFDGVRFGYRCDKPADLEDLYKRTRGEGFGAEVKRRIMMGTYGLSAGFYDDYYVKAQKIRRLIRDDFSKAFTQCDIISGPTAPSTAFGIGEKSNDPVSMYLSDIYTIAVNLAGLPGMSVPAGFVDGMPVGLQLISNHLEEASMLNFAHQYQQHTDWHKQAPNIAEGK